MHGGAMTAKTDATPPPEDPTAGDPPSADGAEVRRLDATGYVCPIPLLMAVREMLELLPGEVLEIVGDDPGIAEDVPAWAELNGHQLLEMEQTEEGVRCRVKKGETDDPLTRGPIEEEYFEQAFDEAWEEGGEEGGETE